MPFGGESQIVMALVKHSAQKLEYLTIKKPVWKATLSKETLNKVDSKSVNTKQGYTFKAISLIDSLLP